MRSLIEPITDYFILYTFAAVRTPINVTGIPEKKHILNSESFTPIMFNWPGVCKIYRPAENSTYHRDGRVARIRGKREDCCRSNRTTRGRGHDESSCANVYLSTKGKCGQSNIP